MNWQDERGSVGPSRLLLDLGEGRLEEAELTAVETLLRTQGLEQPPAWASARAERIAHQHQPVRAARAASPPIRRIIAALTFDSQVQPAYSGLRAGTANIRRLMFQAENIEVDLELSPGPRAEHVRLAGQITAGDADPNGGFLRLTTSAGEWRADLDEGGEFWFDSLAPGSYRLEVVLRDRIIEVPALPI